ncbi:MAG: response regulator [Dehalococcoidia bacterium]|nr:response regulator [Dehalococcoidia bacterium]
MSESIPSTKVRPFAGAGEMARRMNALDWSTTAVGPVETWPERLRTAVDICLASRFPIFTCWGREQATMFYNDAYIPILGPYRHPQWLGRSFNECWSDIWDTIGPMIDGVFDTGAATWSEDLQLMMKRAVDPEEAYFTFSYSPIPGEAGAVDGIFCAVQETTGRVLAERRMRTLRDLAARVLDVDSPDEACERAAATLRENAEDVPFALIYLFDRDRSVAELVAVSGVPRGHPAAPARIALDDGADAVWPLHLATHRTEPVTVRLDGARFGTLPGGPWPESPSEALVLPLIASAYNELTGFVVAGVNPRRALDDSYLSFFSLAALHVAAAIASARAYAEERERAEALAEIDRAKTAFFSNVSHEFRTPLTLLLGPLGDALGQATATDDVVQRERLEVAQRNAERLLRLVNNLLDFSRVEAGRVEASYEATDLSAESGDLTSMFRAAFERAGIELRVDCPPLPQPVYIDREMWEKVVLNLLSNALKFTFQGGVTVSVRAAGPNAELVVRDTGVGIPAPELPRLFERFHRVPGMRSRTHEGSGIGLSLVQELVRLHGGSVRVESTEGEGTTFTVSVPLGSAHLPAGRIAAPRSLQSTASAPRTYVEEALRWLPDATDASGHATAAAAEGLPSPLPGGVAPVRVLVADDNEDMRDYLRRILGAHWAVETVADGAEALDAVRARRPDLVLTDVMMPGLDGFQLVAELRADPATRDLPVIVLSARAGEEARVEGLARGADDYLVKPFAATELVARVAARLEIARVSGERRAALQRQREELYDFIMQAPIPMAVMRGEDVVFELANDALCATTGWHAVVGRSILDVMPGEDGERLAGMVRGVMQSGEQQIAREVPTHVEGVDGPRDLYFDLICSPLRAGEAAASGIIVVGSDVTAQVLARQAIERSLTEQQALNDILERQQADLQRFTTLVETSTDYIGMARVDLPEVFYLNAAARRLVGLGPDEPLPPTIEAYVSPASWDCIRDEAIPTVLADGSWHGEIELRNFRTGEFIAMDQIVFLATDPSGEMNLAMIGRDLRERREMEDELRRANEAKDDFLSMVSHELRTPITTILGNAQVLRLRAAYLDDDARAGSLRDIETEAVRLNRIIANLLLLARLDRGERPDEEPLFAEREIPRVLAEYGKQRPERAVRFEGEGQTMLVAEPGYFEQVLTNLLSNADKYSPPGEAIDVRVRRGSDEATVSVRDRGIGIAPEDAEALFTPFFRSGRSSAHVQGMGIGLAVCKRLVEAQGGRIWMTALPEGGTEASFTLPLARDGWEGDEG